MGLINNTELVRPSAPTDGGAPTKGDEGSATQLTVKIRIDSWLTVMLLKGIVMLNRGRTSQVLTCSLLMCHGWRHEDDGNWSRQEIDPKGNNTTVRGNTKFAIGRTSFDK